jgi:hypothetical protein
MKINLVEVLTAFSSQTLSLIISYRGISLPQKTKTIMIEKLIDLFKSPSHIAESENGLSPAQREVVNLILRHGGKASLVSIRQRLLAAGLIDVQKEHDYSSYSRQPDYKAAKSRKLEDIMANLIALGLVFAWREVPNTNSSSVIDFNLNSLYVIPDEIRKHLKPPPPDPPWVPKEAKTPEKVEESSARSFQRDLYLYWSFVRQNAIELTAKGLIPKRQLVAMNNTLLVRENIQTGQVEEDFHRLFMIRSVLLTLGLLEEQLRNIKTRADASFFALDPLDRIQKTFQAYCKMTWWNEIAWVHPVQVYMQPVHPAPQLILDARTAVLAELKNIKGWVSLADLTKRLAEHNYEFLFPRRIVSSSYYNRTNIYSGNINPGGWEFPGIFSEGDGWQKVEANFIRITMFEFLFWMGLVDAGYSDIKLKQPDLFRLTPAGEWLLGGGKPPSIPKESGQVILQPDFTITAFDPVSDAVLHQLEQFAQRISAERAAVYRLTQQTVYAGQQNGWDASRIKTTLEELSGQPLPPNVARSLAEWQHWHERIRIRRDMVVLQAANPQDLLLLAEDKELSPWLKNQPAPGTSILPVNLDPHQFMSKLANRLWLPEVVLPEAGLPAKSVNVHPDGWLSFNIKSPDLYLKSFLAHFSEAEGKGYRITKASVKRAIANKKSAPQIIKELERVASDVIPAELQKKITAWSGHYGSANLEETLLLQLKDEKAVKELLQDPEFKAIIQILQPDEIKTTLKVSPRDRQRLIELLEERGIDLHLKKP